MGLFESGNCSNQATLHLERQAFRFDKNLVAALVGKTYHLVFDGRTVARTHAFDDAGIHGRLVQAGPDDVVTAFVGCRDVTAHLARMVLWCAQVGHDRHGYRPAVPSSPKNRRCVHRCAGGCPFSACLPAAVDHADVARELSMEDPLPGLPSNFSGRCGFFHPGRSPSSAPPPWHGIAGPSG